MSNIIFILILTNFLIIFPELDISEIKKNFNEQNLEDESTMKLYRSSRGARSLGFTEISTGLPTSGDYNFIAFGDINNDKAIWVY